MQAGVRSSSSTFGRAVSSRQSGMPSPKPPRGAGFRLSGRCAFGPFSCSHSGTQTLGGWIRRPSACVPAASDRLEPQVRSIFVHFLLLVPTLFLALRGSRDDGAAGGLQRRTHCFWKEMGPVPRGLGEDGCLGPLPLTWGLLSAW